MKSTMKKTPFKEEDIWVTFSFCIEGKSMCTTHYRILFGGGIIELVWTMFLGADRKDTVDGRNPAPPGMYKTLWILR